MVLAVMKVVGNVLLLAILIGKLSVLSGEPAASNKCPDRCGEVTIPYPFGIGDECSLSQDFNLTCNETFTPPKPFSGDFQVIDITLSSAQTRVLMDITYDCYNTSGYAGGRYWNVDLTEYSNVVLSYTDNVYTAVGCDTYALIQDGGNSNKYTGGCISVCNNYNDVADGPCTGMGCCQAPIPKKLKNYTTNFQWSNNNTGILDFNPCSYAFLVQKNNYTFHKSDLKGMSKSRQFPIVWDWFIGNETCEQAKNRQDYACLSSNSDCFNSSNGPGYICRCSKGYQGNPYLNDGCQDINECEHPKTYPCNGTCTNTVGGYNCTCPDGASGNPMTYGCTYKPAGSSKELQIAIVVPVVVLSSLLAIALSIWIYALLQRRKLNKLKEKYFSQNGGSILEKRRVSLGKSIQETLKIFTREEIEKATNQYDQSRILGRGGQGVVYKGIIPNGDRTFAIKKSLVMDRSKVGEFINEIIILSQINHRNVVKLIGCCLEVEDPLLVYEFVPKGTLFQNIHSESLPWETRLRISSETAGALAHLHTSVSIPIIHRDVKSSNILLDSDYTAKVSDFGASRLIPIDETQVTTLVQGTLGYLDPEYLQTHQLTDKSDVYSFGVVLCELLTGKVPLSYEGNDEGERSLAMHFISCLKINRLDQ